MQAEPDSIHSLPLPDAESLAHSEKAASRIRQAIAEAGGSISFAEFMQLALYEPGLGYYSAGATKFGAAGDFVTAPELSPLFGRVLARQTAAVLRQLRDPRILELGAGSGALAVQMLGALPDHGIELARYAILEVSADLRQRQERMLRDELPELSTEILWLSELPERFDGVVIANEVADALPVERFERSRDGVLQHRVAVERNRFVWRRDIAPAFLADAVLHVEETIGRMLPDGFVSEVSAGLPGWIDDLASRIGDGFIFLVDYGLTRSEYYAADRSDGWLRCHFRHRAHNDPLIYPGIQDVTAWVDFTTVAEAASAAGMDIAGFVSQAHFLMNGGLEEELTEFTRLPTAAQLELSRQVKMLTLPGEMGEHFKCIGLSRGAIAKPEAFNIADMTCKL